MIGAPAPSALWTSHPPLALLVDRDADTRRMYAGFLTATAGYTVEEAEDGREALAKAIAIHPDIVITETRLPGMNGFALCDLLRADKTTNDIAVVFVTGDAFQKDIREAEAAGADAVLIKPCLPDTLLTEIRRLLQQSTELRARARATSERIRAQIDQSERLLAQSDAHFFRRQTLIRQHNRRETVTPPNAPPSLFCPNCDHSLNYVRSHVGGVNASHAEQWDYFECPSGCGTFQYRQRTRKLRSVS